MNVRLSRRRIRPKRLNRTRGRPKAPLLIAVIIAAAVFFIGNFYINNHLRPIMSQMAHVQVDQMASRIINDAIVKRISDDNVKYGNLVYFEKDIYGHITALKTDIIAINRLRADITKEVLTALEKADTSKISIPIGNLINSDIFSGRGPKIPLKIVPLGVVSSAFSNQFTDAGINQTRHQIMMDIEVDISILLPGYSIGTKVMTQVSVAETVIVGAVPDSYFRMDDLFSRG
jgi:sporulation protein YunB